MYCNYRIYTGTCNIYYKTLFGLGSYIVYIIFVIWNKTTSMIYITSNRQRT